MQCNLCVNYIIAEKSLLRDDPTLSALKGTKISLRLVTSLAEADDHAFLYAPRALRIPHYDYLHCYWTILLVSSATFAGTNFAIGRVSNSLGRRSAKARQRRLRVCRHLPRCPPWLVEGRRRPDCFILDRFHWQGLATARCLNCS